jgi:hypothetical protein
MYLSSLVSFNATYPSNGDTLSPLLDSLDDEMSLRDDDAWGDDKWRKGGKSGKDNAGGGKSGKNGGGGGGGSGKSGKNDFCKVTVTNLSYEQAFSKLFVMLHDKAVTNMFPIYEFGKNPTEEMCDLTQNLNANGLQAFYRNRPGVDKAWITSSYWTGAQNDNYDAPYLNGGDRFEFMIRPGADWLSIAAGFPFANDGGIVLQAAPIYDGAEYYLPAIDSGCEANLQTCWSVPAMKKEFPPQSACFDENLSDENDNSFGGENFVSIHRGMQDLEKGELDVLTLLACEDVELNNADDDTRFALYFLEEGYDDDWLLCKEVAGNNCNLRGDDDFLDYIDRNDDVVGDDDVLIRIARNSADFDDFCDRIDEINDGLESAFTTLEPVIFDFRNPIARVEIDC